MVCGFATERPPSWHELQHAILRNFGGLDTVKPIDVFNKYLKHIGRNTKVIQYCDCSVEEIIALAREFLFFKLLF